MQRMRSAATAASVACLLALGVAGATDIVVSVQDGKFVRVEGRSTYPQPAPPDSLVVIDLSCPACGKYGSVSIPRAELARMADHFGISEN